jgi:predicted nucleic acid-binding protein
VSGFLLDTNGPSELMNTRPEPRVGKWMFAQPETELFMSVVTIGELYKGFALAPSSKRRAELERWFHHDLLPRFKGRILPVTFPIAKRWGVLEAQCKRKGIALKTADGMIAATALHHGLTIATRDVDFAELGVTILNPWEIA